jgi:hypothetical protein
MRADRPPETATVDAAEWNQRAVLGAIEVLREWPGVNVALALVDESGKVVEVTMSATTVGVDPGDFERAWGVPVSAVL